MRDHTFFASLGYAIAFGMATTMAVAMPTDFPEEAPEIRVLLDYADKYEADVDNADTAWLAAILYCEASRLGSIEAQYRLGMLYAFGKGVPENNALAAALFSVAGRQGHYEAQNMLETINLTSSELPACVTSATLPEKAPEPVVADTANDDISNIDRHLATLPETKRWILDLVDRLAKWYDIDPKLVLAIIAVESNFEVKAQSPKAAMGLMQLIPGTAERFNIKNAFDASQNIKGGIKYLRWLLSYYHGNIALVVAAYNAGENAVDRYHGVPPYPETQNYVRRVLELYPHQFQPYDENIVAPSPIVSRRG